MATGKIRRLSPAELAEQPAVAYHDPELGAVAPMILEYMSLTAYEDGSARKPSSVTLFVQDGVLKCVLKDPDNQRALWAAGETLWELMETLEAMLCSTEAVWRVDRTNGEGTASRIKKR